MVKRSVKASWAQQFLQWMLVTVKSYLALTLNHPMTLKETSLTFFFWWCYSYGPQQGPDRQQKKKREGSSRGESKRKLLKETQNQGRETRKKKRIQEEY